MKSKAKNSIPKEIQIYIREGIRQTWTIARVKETIVSNDEALKRALMIIYSFQTQDEKQHEGTFEANGKGFNANDAFILSSFAEQLQTRGFLSQKQIAIAKKKMTKYAKQIYVSTLVPKATDNIGKQLTLIE